MSRKRQDSWADVDDDQAELATPSRYPGGVQVVPDEHLD
jgi:hypothetical protein